MPADIRSFFGGGPPKASQGSEGSQKKDEVGGAMQCFLVSFSVFYTYKLYLRMTNN